MDVQLPACSERELEHRQTLTLLVTLYPAAKVQWRRHLSFITDYGLFTDYGTPSISAGIFGNLLPTGGSVFVSTR